LEDWLLSHDAQSIKQLRRIRSEEDLAGNGKILEKGARSIADHAQRHAEESDPMADANSLGGLTEKTVAVPFISPGV
jgi:hypothetical protein